MNNGGNLESKRDKDNDESYPSYRRAHADEFARAISRIAVAQICESVGFESFNDSSLEALADIMVRYLSDLGKTANFYANSAGRTEFNAFDTIQALEDLGLSSGFLGAAEVNQCVSSSGIIREIVNFVESTEEIPFAQSVPHFPVVRNLRLTPSFLKMVETPGVKHIPAWLPAFPDPHTYVHSPMWNERTTDPRSDKIELARQRRKAERSLLSLQQRLVSNHAAVASTSSEPTDIRQGLQISDSKNPFLAQHAEAREKEVSPVVMPTKLSSADSEEHNVSLLETFAPAIEAMKFGICESEDGAEKILPEKRPTVRLTFKTGKKIFSEPLDLSLRNKTSGKTFWLGRDDEKDDKKRRAEFILRQSMENPQELTQF